MRRNPFALAPLVAAAACATVQTTQPGEMGVTRQQRIIPYVVSEVHAAAARQYAEIITRASRDGSLDRDQQQITRLRSITRRLVAQTGHLRPGAPSWSWEVHLVTDRAVNAWCMPGGKMALYTGFLDRLHPTDDELAAVMGHEIIHALREHGAERVSEQLATGFLLEVAASALGLDERRALVAQLLTQVMFTLPNSRQYELEADALGVLLAARAGFDPAGAVTLWQKWQMMSQDGGSRPEYLSTHPSHATRVRENRQHAQRVATLYRQARARLAEPTVRAAEIRTAQAPTPAAPAGPATLSIATRPLATIFVNDERVGSNPILNYPVQPGPVRLRFEVTDNTGTWAEELTVTFGPGEVRNLGRVLLTRPDSSPKPHTAFLTVATLPLAVIVVNGERASGNPIVNYPVPAGAVRLRFLVTDDVGTWYQDFEITLTAGENRNLGRIRLTRP